MQIGGQGIIQQESAMMSGSYNVQSRQMMTTTKARGNANAEVQLNQKLQGRRQIETGPQPQLKDSRPATTKYQAARTMQAQEAAFTKLGLQGPMNPRHRNHG